MPGECSQCDDALLGSELQQLVLVELLGLRTCLTVAEKALLWQAPRIGLEASIVLEASMMYTGNVELRLSGRVEAIAGRKMRSNDGERKLSKVGSSALLELFAL